LRNICPKSGGHNCGGGGRHLCQKGRGSWFTAQRCRYASCVSVGRTVRETFDGGSTTVGLFSRPAEPHMPCHPKETICVRSWWRTGATSRGINGSTRVGLFRRFGRYGRRRRGGRCPTDEEREGERSEHPAGGGHGAAHAPPGEGRQTPEAGGFAALASSAETGRPGGAGGEDGTLWLIGTHPARDGAQARGSRHPVPFVGDRGAGYL
jgi:hypothetical protein